MHEVNPVGDVLINEIPWDCLEIVFRVFYFQSGAFQDARDESCS